MKSSGLSVTRVTRIMGRTFVGVCTLFRPFQKARRNRETVGTTLKNQRLGVNRSTVFHTESVQIHTETAQIHTETERIPMICIAG
jgi:hypothetical protein